MNADVMITRLAFCLEVFPFGLALGLFVAHEVRNSRSQATAETGRERLEPVARRTRPRPSASANLLGVDVAQPGTTHAGRAARGLRA